jgi:hypothetical protein
MAYPAGCAIRSSDTPVATSLQRTNLPRDKGSEKAETLRISPKKPVNQGFEAVIAVETAFERKPAESGDMTCI